MSQLALFNLNTAPTLPTPAPRTAKQPKGTFNHAGTFKALTACLQPAPTTPAQVDDDPDEEAPAIVGSLSAGQLAHHYYQITCPLNCVGSTEFCHNCALFQSATRFENGSIKIDCKAHQYADEHGHLLEGYGLIPGHIKDSRGFSKIQWVKEFILESAPVIRERPAREVQYQA